MELGALAGVEGFDVGAEAVLGRLNVLAADDGAEEGAAAVDEGVLVCAGVEGVDAVSCFTGVLGALEV